MPRRAPFSRAALEEAVAASLCSAEALRRLGLRAAGGNFRTIRKYIALWEIDASHFDANKARAAASRGRAVPLEDVLGDGRPYHRGHLKERLYRSGMKERRCELCGQDERWRGREMSLVLDHINGQADDNRLENLRIVCPNCAATLDTHCGRNLPRTQPCAHCGHRFRPKAQVHRYCSLACAGAARRGSCGVPQPHRRKVERPPYEELVAEVRAHGYLATGRRYGVSDNAIRKWLRWYERLAEAEQKPGQAAA